MKYDYFTNPKLFHHHWRVCAVRDLKFRAYRNDMMSKPFTLGEAVCWPNGSVSTAGGLSNVMQYTGQKGFGGVEIFEGDIVEIKPDDDDDYSYISAVTVKGVISVYGYEFDYTLIEWCDDLSPSNIKVIGNIYENPELLESQK